jgi:hypothetical protein
MNYRIEALKIISIHISHILINLMIKNRLWRNLNTREAMGKKNLNPSQQDGLMDKIA